MTSAAEAEGSEGSVGHSGTTMPTTCEGAVGHGGRGAVWDDPGGAPLRRALAPGSQGRSGGDTDRDRPSGSAGAPGGEPVPGGARGGAGPRGAGPRGAGALGAGAGGAGGAAAGQPPRRVRCAAACGAQAAESPPLLAT